MNATGGGNGIGTNNNGLHFAANYSAPDIIAEANGGFGQGSDASNGNYGVYVGSGITLGGTGANQIRLTGTSLGTGSFEFGIAVEGGTVQVGDGGTLSLKGSGGGLYNGTGASNYGVELADGTLTAGNGGSSVNTINVSGLGGVGSGGTHHGVDIETIGFHVNLNGSNPSNSINFIDCTGGSGGNSNYGVNFSVGVTLVNGSLNFLNVAGGGSGASTTNYGLNIGAAVTAPVITGRDIAGGPGTNQNFGLFINALLGTSATNVLTMTASSMGLGMSEYGINVANTVTVGSGATLTLTGTGGGNYNGTGTLNHGIYLNGATLTSSGAGASVMTLTGLGGSGNSANAGAYIDTGGLTVNFGTNANNQPNILNCIGGFVGSNNYGVCVGRNGYDHRNRTD